MLQYKSHALPSPRDLFPCNGSSPPAETCSLFLCTTCLSVRKNANSLSYFTNLQLSNFYFAFAEGGEERQHVSTSRTSTSWVIPNALPNTNYSIYVRSYSVRSASAQSERVYCTTLEDCKSFRTEQAHASCSPQAHCYLLTSKRK